MTEIKETDEDVEQLDFSYIACRDVKWYNYLENSLVVSEEVKHTANIRSSYSTPRYLFKRKGSIFPHKDLYMNVHSSVICNSPGKEKKNPNIDQQVNA